MWFGLWFQRRPSLVRWSLKVLNLLQPDLCAPPINCFHFLLRSASAMVLQTIPHTRTHPHPHPPTHHTTHAIPRSICQSLPYITTNPVSGLHRTGQGPSTCEMKGSTSSCRTIHAPDPPERRQTGRTCSQHPQLRKSCHIALFHSLILRGGAASTRMTETGQLGPPGSLKVNAPTVLSHARGRQP